MGTSLLFIFLGVICAVGFLIEISLLLRELIKTMKRIEARLTLLMPLESEKKCFGEDFLLRRRVEERAIQPDIWTHKIVEERQGLKGDEYRELRKIQRSTERRVGTRSC